jgi:hypothetical protein
MKNLGLLKNKAIYSFLAALIISFYIYFVVRAGQLFPVPFSANGVSDNTSVIALYVNIIFVWFLFFFFYICLSIIEIFVNLGKNPDKNTVQTQ